MQLGPILSRLLRPIFILALTAPAVALHAQATAPAVAFTSTAVGSSTTGTATFTFTATTIVTGINVLTQGITGLDYTAGSAGTGACTGSTGTPKTYMSGNTCTVAVKFAPAVPGLRRGAVTLTTSSGTAATAYLSGAATSPQAVLYPGTKTYPITNLINTDAIAVDAGANIYLSDIGGNDIIKETYSAGAYTASTVGSGLGASEAIAVDGAGNLYYSDPNNQRVLEETYNAATQTYTQSVLLASTTAYGLAVDASGTLYLGEGASLIKAVPSGSGTYTQTTIRSTYGQITGIAVDTSGNLYIADSQASTLYKETYSSGAYTQSTIAGGQSFVSGIAIDAGGSVYSVSNTTTVPRFTPSGTGYVQTTAATFGQPEGIALDGAGNIYITDNSTKSVGLVSVSTPLTFNYGSVVVGATPAAQTAVLTNIGTGALTNSSVAITGPYVLSTGTGYCATGSSTIALDSSCNLGISFKPTVVGNPETGTVTTTNNSLNVSGAQQTVNLTGIATYNQVITTPPPATLQYGQNAGTVVATLENSSGAAVSGLSQSVSLAVTATSPSYSQTYTATTTNGVASFNLSSAALTSSGASTTYTYTFTSANSNTATATETVYPYTLVITTPPTTPVNATGNAGTVQVTVENHDGSTATTQTPTVTLTVTGPGAYSQTYTATPSSGIASFNLSSVPLNKAGTYTYVASSPTLVSGSATQTVNVGPIASLALTSVLTQPYATVANNITVTGMDAGGNITTASTDSITLTANPTSATGVPITFALASGTYTTPVTFATAVGYILTATDNTTAGITGSLSLTVQPFPAFTVTTATDDATGTASNCNNTGVNASGGTATPLATCSLRDAIAATNAVNFTGTTTAAPTITFALPANTPTLSLAKALGPTANASIAGPGSALLTIQPSTNNAYSAIYSTTARIAFSLSGVTLTHFGVGGGNDANSAVSMNGSSASSPVLLTLSNDLFQANGVTSSALNGGAVSISFGSLVVTGSTFLGNLATDGGAIYTASATATAGLVTPVTISGCTFGSLTGTTGAANQSTGPGGAVYLGSSTATIGSSSFGYNTATNGSAVYNTANTLTLNTDVFLNNNSTTAGGAVYTTGQLVVANSTFNSNTASIDGGAIYASNLVTISGSSFSSNLAGKTSTAYGGAIYSAYTAASGTISNTNFISNKAQTTAAAEGGGLYANRMNLTNVLFSQNSVSGSTTADGGGVYLGSTSVISYLTGVTFTGNSTANATNQYGGGLFAGYASLYNSTLTGNSAAMGGGFYTVSAAYLFNSVISGNTASTSYPDSYPVTGSTNSYANVASSKQCTTSCNPLLSALGSYGGGTVGAPGYTTPVQVMIPLPGSSLLAAGSTSYVYSSTYTSPGTVLCNGAATETDARGCLYPRTLTEASASHVDIGATEANYTLAFLQQPPNGIAGGNLNPAPTVQVSESGVAFNATPFAGAGTLTVTAAAGTPTTTNTLANSGLDTLAVNFSASQAADTLTAAVRSSAATPVTVASVTSNAFNITSNYIWLVDNSGALNKLTESGTASASDAATAGTSSLGGVAFDSTGNTWSVTSADNALAFTSYANTTSTTYTGGGISTPVSVAVDGSGNVWTANAGNSSLSEFNNSGTALSPASTGYNGSTRTGSGPATGSFATPSSVVLDNTGGVWVTNGTGGSVTHVFGAATPVTTPLSQAVKSSTLGTQP